MIFRFWRRIRLFSGAKLNLSKRGASLSVGPRGAKVTLGRKGVRATVGLPGTGVFLSEYRPWHGKSPPIVNVPEHLQPIIEKRGPYWEFVLVGQAFDDRINEINTSWDESVCGKFNLPAFCQWSGDHIQVLGQLSKNLSDLSQVDLIAAVGQRDESKIIDVVTRVADTMKQVAQWEQVVRLMMEHPIYGKLAGLMSGMSRPLIDQINEFRRQYFEQLATIAQTDRWNIHINTENLPNTDELIAALKRFSVRALEKGAILGDFYQTHFSVQRESAELGTFSRSSVIENLRCGLFRADDVYWSENLQKWRRLPELENDVELTI